MLVSWLCHKRWTQIFQFFSMRMWSSTYTMHTRSLNFSINCLSNLRFFFHLLCRAVPLFRSALFGPYTQSILNDTQTEKEKGIVEKSREKNQFFQQAPSAMLRFMWVICLFHPVLFIFTHSQFVQTIYGCAHHICCVCHIPFSTSPDSWASLRFICKTIGLSLSVSLNCPFFMKKEHTSTNGKKNENKPTATTTHPQKITQISGRIPNIPKATENQLRAQISHNNCEARCVHAQWKTCVWWFLLVEFMESTHKNTMHCSACGTFVENAQATAINLGHFIYDSIIRLIANGQQ